MSGYVKMSRGWLDDEMFQDAPYSERDAWAWMICEANWQDGRVSVNGRPVTIKRGQFCSSFRFMSRKFKWSPNKVIRFIERLKEWGVIKTSTEHGENLITICNYSKYQDKKNSDGTENETPPEQHRNTGEYKLEENQEIQEKKEEGGAPANDPAFEKFWEAYPRQRRGSKEKARKAYLRALSRASPEEIHAACEAYAASDEVRRGFAKGCEAWLNDDRWTVDYSAKQGGNDGRSKNGNHGNQATLGGKSERARRAAYAGLGLTPDE